LPFCDRGQSCFDQISEKTAATAKLDTGACKRPADGRASITKFGEESLVNHRGAGAVIGLLALGLSAAEAAEPCPATPGETRQGVLIDVHLCVLGYERCRADPAGVYRAERTPSPAPLLIQDIPDGAVATGGALFSSSYDTANLGFKLISVTGRTDKSDYCALHSSYLMAAQWIGESRSDKADIQICVYFDQWRGAPPPAQCSAP
jgi:hypothetical protein